MPSPLMFSEEEIEALAPGAKWVSQRTDEALSTAAGGAMAKIAAVLPNELRRRLDDSSLLVGKGWERPQKEDLSLLREAIRTERKLSIAYRDVKGARSARVIWPFLLGFLESTACSLESTACSPPSTSSRKLSAISVPTASNRRRWTGIAIRAAGKRSSGNGDNQY